MEQGALEGYYTIIAIKFDDGFTIKYEEASYNEREPNW